MSLPDWNDLPVEARKEARRAATYHGVEEWNAGQCALEVYEAIRSHVPPEVFPLFTSSLAEQRKVALEAHRIIGTLAHITQTFEHPEVLRALQFFLDFSLGLPTAPLLFPWPQERIKPRVRVRAGRRML